MTKGHTDVINELVHSHLSDNLFQNKQVINAMNLTHFTLLKITRTDKKTHVRVHGSKIQNIIAPTKYQLNFCIVKILNIQTQRSTLLLFLIQPNSSLLKL